MDWQQKQTLTLKEQSDKPLSLLWSIPFPQGCWPPVEVYITDDGRYVVLLDAWHNVGYGKVLVFLGPMGKVLKSYPLDQLLTEAEILDAPLSVSSLWWSSDARFFLLRGQTRFGFTTRQGTVRIFNLATGQKLALTPERTREARETAIQLARRDLSLKDTYQRMSAARQLGTLKDQESLPLLLRLLDDPTVTSRGNWIVSETYKGGRLIPGRTKYVVEHGVQTAAGQAVVALMGARAAPLFERKLLREAPRETETWIWLLSKTGRARTSPAVARLTRSRDPEIRTAAIVARLEGDDGTVLRQNRQWLKDRDSQVRYQAIRVLAEHARKEDAPLLREALKSKDSTVAFWASRGLVRLQRRTAPPAVRREP